MSKISTLHQSFVSVIPDRLVTSDRPSTRSRLFGFAKHKSQKSSGIAGDVVRKREEIGENVCEDKENVRPSFRRSRALTVTPFSRGADARNRACAAAEVESMKPPVSNLRPKLESQVIKVNDGSGVLVARTPFASVANTDAAQSSDLVQQDARKPVKRGRSPERPKAMQYKRRYSIALRGLTPSPTRPTKDNDAMEVDSNPRAHAAEIEEEELMTSPVRRNSRLARRPPTPCRSVALVKPRPIGLLSS
ncbi:hypothetical protein BJ165DRAFT_1408192 [Panaeolus papilionaceus]|nr:hypothetical protein BJ165DRAFT_1408192 [Panaeolus papilionaceus]